MAKCTKCGKKGLFLKLTNGLCKECLISTKNNHSLYLSLPADLSVPNDVLDLLWFNDGNFKNYIPNETIQLSLNGKTITYTFNLHEPSLISLKEPISKELNEIVKPLPYFPTYYSTDLIQMGNILTPEQRRKYFYVLNHLDDPTNDIGYIFLFYYGLERHLICGKFENAYEMILKLRKVYKNKSFLTYSFTSCLVSAIINQRSDLAERLLTESSDETLATSHINIFILALLLFKKPFTAKQLMLFARRFDFTNTRLIKEYPDIFKMQLERILKITPFYPFEKLSNVNFQYQAYTHLFANSTININLPIPSFIDIPSFKNFGYDLLLQAHENVKKYIKDNNIKTLTQPKPKKVFKIDYSDIRYENYLESLELISDEFYNTLIKYYVNDKFNFYINITMAMNQVFFCDSNEFWLLRNLKTLKKLRSEIISLKQFEKQLKTEIGISFSELLENYDVFYDYAAEMEQSENENLLKAYIEFCRIQKPIFYIQRGPTLLGKTTSYYFKRGIDKITDGLIVLQTEIKQNELITNANIEDIAQMNKNQFKRFLVIKFRAMHYEIKGLSKGTAFVVVKDSQNILIDYKNTKSKTTLKSIDSALLTMTYLNTPELWIYSMSGFAEDIIQYACENGNIKLFGKDDIAALTKRI